MSTIGFRYEGGFEIALFHFVFDFLAFVLERDSFFIGGWWALDVAIVLIDFWLEGELSQFILQILNLRFLQLLLLTWLRQFVFGVAILSQQSRSVVYLRHE